MGVVNLGVKLNMLAFIVGCLVLIGILFGKANEVEFERKLYPLKEQVDAKLLAEYRFFNSTFSTGLRNMLIYSFYEYYKKEDKKLSVSDFYKELLNVIKGNENGYFLHIRHFKINNFFPFFSQNKVTVQADYWLLTYGEGEMLPKNLDYSRKEMTAKINVTLPSNRFGLLYEKARNFYFYFFNGHYYDCINFDGSKVDVRKVGDYKGDLDWEVEENETHVIVKRVSSNELYNGGELIFVLEKGKGFSTCIPIEKAKTIVKYIEEKIEKDEEFEKSGLPLKLSGSCPCESYGYGPCSMGSSCSYLEVLRCHLYCWEDVYTCVKKKLASWIKSLVEEFVINELNKLEASNDLEYSIEVRIPSLSISLYDSAECYNNNCCIECYPCEGEGSSSFYHTVLPQTKYVEQDSLITFSYTSKSYTKHRKKKLKDYEKPTCHDCGECPKCCGCWDYKSYTYLYQYTFNYKIIVTIKDKKNKLYFVE
jgi:hypothetical protein